MKVGVFQLFQINGDPELSWHICNELARTSLILPSAKRWKPTTDQLYQCSWCGQTSATVIWKWFGMYQRSSQYPMPSPKRCYDSGKAIKRAVESYDKDLKVGCAWHWWSFSSVGRWACWLYQAKEFDLYRSEEADRTTQKSWLSFDSRPR